MSTHRPRATGPHTGDDALLAEVLRAAAAPAHPGELAGEEAAVAAFRQAAPVGTAPSRPSAARRVLAKVLTVKAAVAIAVTGSAGVVLAASGGVLPTPWSAAPSTEQAPTVTATTAPAATGDRGAPDPSAGSGPSTAPAERAVVDLCRTYPAGNGGHRADPKFRPLIEAAGGADEVAEYCATHAPTTSKKPSKNEPGNGSPTKSPNTGKSGKNTPPAPPGESVPPGKNPTGEADTPSRPARPESAVEPSRGAVPPSATGAPSRGRS
ncbi:hypothetical protein [Actinophytocola sp. NPDC049390]|uniref:hypothetical protein n=1 Tax=Actinophytocola sp. NPDC049390 TaxID=3363894 RepID=UPI00378FE919